MRSSFTLSIGSKLLVTTVVCTVLMLAVAASGYWGIVSISANSDRILKHEARIAEHAAFARCYVLEMHRFEKEMLLNSQDLEKVQECQDRFDVERLNLQHRLKMLDELVESSTDRELVAEMHRGLDVYLAGMAGVVSQIKAGKIRTPQQGNEAVQDFKDEVVLLGVNAEELADAAKKDMRDVGQRLEARSRTTLTMMLGFSATAIVLGSLLSISISRGLTRSLRRMVALLDDVAQGEGDLTRRIAVDSKDEMGQMAGSVNRFIGRIHEIAQQVKASGTKVSRASAELAASADHLATSSATQAAALRQSTTSLDQMAQTVRQNADSAEKAKELSVASRATGEAGASVIADAVEAMGTITQASERISLITSTIDELAFQTNLLALNAAVEAARAGDAGRGFAVVAAEIRRLAQSSAASAREIKEIIQDSHGKVTKGSALVRESGATFEKIVASVRRVSDLIGSIAAATRQQSGGIDQVAAAVGHIDNVVQDNRNRTDRLSEMSRLLTATSRELSDLIARFKLAESTPESRVSPTASPKNGKWEDSPVSPVLQQRLSAGQRFS